MDMDSLTDLSQIGQQLDQGPRFTPPSSPSLDEELFHQVFDWSSYCQSTQPFDSPSHSSDSSHSRSHSRSHSHAPSRSSRSSHSSHSHYPSHPSPQELSKLITEIPSVIDTLSLEKLKLGNDLYRMKAPFRSDDDEASSSDYSGHSPPELIRGGGSTSPSDHSGSLVLDQAEDARHRSDVTLREVQAQDDEWTYPQSDISKTSPRGYPHLLQVSEDQSRKAVPADQSAGLKRRRSGQDLAKRQRQLADPLQTADVRKNGACLPCRLTKTRCHDSGVCPTCRQAFPEHSHLVCTRMTPAMAWPVIGKVPDVWSKAATEEEELCTGPRFYTGKPREIAVFFTKDTSSSALRATVQAYRSREGSDEGSPRMADFPRECVPSHATLQKWVEGQIRREHKADFQHGLQSFLLAYSEEGWGLPRHGLVSKVHKMNCFFKIWKTSSFWCRDPANNLVSLPLSVQAQLRNIARKGLFSLEHDILKELDDCLSNQGPPKSDERLAIWASMWQLMLIYRDLLTTFKSSIMRIAQNQSEAPTIIAWQKDMYTWLADSFFPLLTIFYHYQFRTKKSLELSIDWIKSPQYPHVARHSKAIIQLGQLLFDCRKGFCIQSSKNDMDRLLCVFVVNHELKKLAARKRAPAASSKSKKGKTAAMNDDCDDE